MGGKITGGSRKHESTALPPRCFSEHSWKDAPCSGRARARRAAPSWVCCAVLGTTESGFIFSPRGRGRTLHAQRSSYVSTSSFSTSPGTDSALGEFLCHQLSWICSAGSFLIIGKGAALPKLFLCDARRQECLSQAWSLCVSRRKPQEQRAPAQPVSLQQLRGTAS